MNSKELLAAEEFIVRPDPGDPRLSASVEGIDQTGAVVATRVVTEKPLTLFLNRQEIMERCLIEVFDRMTSYDKKNKIHWEGWKTNDAYKVNRKVIMPHYVNMNWSSRFEVEWRKRETLDDIDKVMCMLSGKRFENILTIENALKAKFEEIGPIGVGQSFDNKAESEFFRMKFWKKGTFHIEFLDEALWAKFNQTAAKGKNWLPGG